MHEQAQQLTTCLSQQERDPPKGIELWIDLHILKGILVCGLELAAKAHDCHTPEASVIGPTWFLTSRWYHSSLSCAFKAALRRDRVALMPIWLLSCRAHHRGMVDRSMQHVGMVCLLGWVNRWHAIEPRYTQAHQLFAEVVPEVADQVYKAIPCIRLCWSSQTTQASSQTRNAYCNTQ